MKDLAAAYAALLDQLDVFDVTAIGNSFGGWIAAEIALLNSPRVSGAVIVDGIGIEVEGLHVGGDEEEADRAKDSRRTKAVPARWRGPFSAEFCGFITA